MQQVIFKKRFPKLRNVGFISLLWYTFSLCQEIQNSRQNQKSNRFLFYFPPVLKVEKPPKLRMIPFKPLSETKQTLLIFLCFGCFKTGLRACPKHRQVRSVGMWLR